MYTRAIQCFAEALYDAEVKGKDLRDALLAYFTWATTERMASFPSKAASVPEDLTLVRSALEGRL